MGSIHVGCDVCQVAAIEEMLRGEESALAKIFLRGEREYAMAQGRPAQHLAGVFAAKEALAKAVRDPALLGAYYQEVTVSHRENGSPDLLLSERLTASFSAEGIRVADLSISHDGDYAVAAVIVERGRLQCDRCLLTLASLQEQGIADALIPVVLQNGQRAYRCPVCMRGW